MNPNRNTNRGATGQAVGRRSLRRSKSKDLATIKNGVAQ